MEHLGAILWGILLPDLLEHRACRLALVALAAVCVYVCVYVFVCVCARACVCAHVCMLGCKTCNGTAAPVSVCA